MHVHTHSSVGLASLVLVVTQPIEECVHELSTALISGCGTVQFRSVR